VGIKRERKNSRRIGRNKERERENEKRG